LHLLDKLKEDVLCNHLVVLALDRDEAETQAAEDLKVVFSDRCTVHFVTNPVQHPLSPFPICKVWNNMGSVAFKQIGSFFSVMMSTTKYETALLNMDESTVGLVGFMQFP
jgi:hypothetical protein